MDVHFEVETDPLTKTIYYCTVGSIFNSSVFLSSLSFSLHLNCIVRIDITYI